MTTQEIMDFFKDFLKSKEWRKIREVLLWKLDTPYWIVDEDGEFIYRVKQDRSYCRMIKASRAGEKRCQKEILQNIEMVKQNMKPCITRCFANFLGFLSPITVQSGIVRS